MNSLASRFSSRAFAHVRGAVLVTAALGLGSVSGACSDGFGRPRATRRLEITFEPDATGAAPNLGTAAAPLRLAIDTAVLFNVKVRAVNLDGSTDASFTRYVRMSAKPGAIEPLTGPDVDGRNILLKNGESVPVQIRLANAYGLTYIVADDLGYVPTDPLRDPPPGCSDGIDNDGDGAIDYPADEGCAFANDDAEEGGTYAEGASPAIYFDLPRVAEVRGRRCVAGRGCSGSGETPYPREQIQVDTGYREPANGPASYRFSTVVTRISSDGFYVSDLGDTQDGFNNIFSFNFNAPPRMRVCDRLKTFGGTANEFFGFTQVAYPTWTLEEWDPKARLCLVPEPTILLPGTLREGATTLLPLSGGLVRTQTLPDRSSVVKVTPKFGPGDVPCRSGGTVAVLDDPTKCEKDPISNRFLFVPGADATNCDLDKNGNITFARGNPEGDCATTCQDDPECTEFSNYRTRSTFRLTVTNANGSAAVQADATASAGFDALALKGVELRAFTGTLHYFSGGSQFTIEARCKDDIVLDVKSNPLRGDVPCVATPECPAGFECLPLQDGSKGCRARSAGNAELAAPPLACIFPRTFVENNPQ